MEDLQVIETTSGRQFKPWASREDVQAIKQETVQAVVQAVQDPASITAITSEIASGKQAIAAAINAKGVQDVSPTDSFDKLAQDIQSIQQKTININSQDWYGAQIGAGGDLWDLYSILAQMKNQWLGTSLYKALIVCGFNKGYDSLQLQGADAYYTCDGDYYETSTPLHTWHDSDNGKLNRWVCFLYSSEGARLDITNTAISPRSMYIGGHIGTIEYFVNGRLEELVCGIETTDKIDNFFSKNFTQNWNSSCIIRNVGNMTYIDGNPSSAVAFSSSQVNNVLDVENACVLSTQARIGLGNTGIVTSKALFIKIKGVKNCILVVNTSVVKSNNIDTTDIEIYDTDNITNSYTLGGYQYLISVPASSKLKRIFAPDLNYFNGFFVDNTAVDLIDLTVGSMNSKLYINAWNPTNVLADPDKTATLIDNIKNHILARVSDATGGTQLVFTVSTNMYNAIANENIEWQGETMTLADAFLTKNWLFAGA